MGRAAAVDAYNYDGFISYRTAADSDFAPKIQDGLEQLAKPWNRRKALKIFQDIDDLAASPDLGAALHAVFDASRTLVFLASPGAAESEWCNDELQYWIRERPPEHLVVVLTDGTLAFDTHAEHPVDFEASTAAPPAFAELTSMPLYIDMTAERRRADTLDFRTDSEFRLHLTKVAARLHSNRTGEEIEPRDIDSSDRTEFLKARRLRQIAIVALTVLTVLALAAAVVAEVQRRSAEQGRRTALSKQLASQSVAVSGEQFDLGPLLAIEAYRVVQTPEALGSMIVAADRSTDVRRTLHGHDRPLRSVVYDPTGRVLATGGLDGVIILWDAETLTPVGEPLRPAASDPTNPPALRSVVFNGDGSLLAAAGSDASVHLWNVADVDNVERLAPIASSLHDGRSVEAIAFTVDGSSIASGGGLGADGNCGPLRTSTIVLTDIASRRESELGTVDQCVYGLGASPTEPLLASAQSDGTVTIWETESATVRSTIQAHGRSTSDGFTALPAQAVAFSPDGAHLASAGWDGAVHVWDVDTLSEPVVSFTGHTGIVRSVVYSADGTRVASGDRDHQVKVWDPETGEEVGGLTAQHSAEVRSVGFHPNGRFLASGGADQKVIVWALDPNGRRSMSAALHGGTTRAVAVDETRQLVVSAGADVILDERGVKRPGLLWSAIPSPGSGMPVAVVKTSATADQVTAVAIDPDTGTVVSGDVIGRLTLWDMDTRERRTTLPGPDALGCADLFSAPSAIRSLAVDPSSALVAIGHANGAIVVTGAPLGGGGGGDGDGGGDVRCERGIGQVWDLAFSPDGSRLAATVGRGRVLVWDLQDDTRTRLVAAAEDVQSVAFDPSGDLLAIGGSDGDIVVFEVQSLTQVGQPLIGHERPVQDLAFSPDGTLLASASSDRSILLWNVATRAQLVDGLLAHRRSVLALAWFADGRAMVSGGRGEAVVWDFQPASLRRLLCSAANRNLTVFEWDAYVGATSSYRQGCGDLPA